MKLEIVNFIKNNSVEALKTDPYNLIVKEKDNLILFKYHQLYSNMSLKICQEARGLILEKDTWKVVRCAFFKFFNYGESNAAKIDFKTMKVQEKIDGSLISLYYYNKWNVATSGMIDAKDAGLQFETEEFKNYFDLFNSCKIDYSILNPDYTYTFELVSKYNRIVVPYADTEIFHTGTRNNKTLQELNDNIGIKKPKVYSFNTLEDIINNAKQLPYNQEGYVVVDSKWNRIKIKSPAYAAIHHLKGEGKVSKKRLLTLVRKGEKEEFLNYFPEYKEDFESVENLYNIYMNQLEIDTIKAFDRTHLDRKTFAEWAIKQINPGMLFQYYGGKIKKAIDYIDKINESKLLELLTK